MENTMSPSNDHPEFIIEALLAEWKAAIDTHDPEAVAALFSEDAIFQGFRPTHSVGRAGVAEYYAAQPFGMTAGYDVLTARRVGQDAIVAYVAAEFSFVDRETLPVHLTVVAEHVGTVWELSHYHVSRVA